MHTGPLIGGLSDFNAEKVVEYGRRRTGKGNGLEKWDDKREREKGGGGD